MAREMDAWLEEMILELRMKDVPGTAIGEVVAEVESHCADSGESPQEAFGDPRAYARSLEFPGASAPRWGRLLSPIAAGLVALMLAPPTVTAVRRGSDVVLSWGTLLWFVVFAVLVAVLVRFLRVALDHPVLAAAAFAVAFAALFALPIIVPTPALTVPPLVSGTLAAAGLVWSVIGHRGMDEISDPVIDPVSPSDRFADDAPGVEAMSRLTMGRYVFVAVTALMCVVAWVAA